MPVVLLLGMRDIVKVSYPFDPFDKRSAHNWYLFLCLCVLRSGHIPTIQSREAIRTVCDSLASGGSRRDPTHLTIKRRTVVCNTYPQCSVANQRSRWRALVIWMHRKKARLAHCEVGSTRSTQLEKCPKVSKPWGIFLYLIKKIS